MSLFVLHRGLIIAFIQVLFTSIFYFIALPVFQGWLMIGYSTYYTMMPVFALCLHTELSEQVVFTYPELYAELRTGRLLSTRTFLGWVLKSVYQAGVIVGIALVLFGNQLVNFVSVSFSALIISELLNVASEVHPHWHPLMVVAELLTAVIYVYSLFIIRSYFSVSTVLSFKFVWKVAAIVAASWIPVHTWKLIRRRMSPSQLHKLSASTSG
jgi:phospholipid-translocating ATPase